MKATKNFIYVYFLLGLSLWDCRKPNTDMTVNYTTVLHFALK